MWLSLSRRRIHRVTLFADEMAVILRCATATVGRAEARPSEVVVTGHGNCAAGRFCPDRSRRR